MNGQFTFLIVDLLTNKKALKAWAQSADFFLQLDDPVILTVSSRIRSIAGRDDWI